MNLKKVIKDALGTQDFIEFVYLFGSQAKDKTHPLSDYDIAVYIDPDKTPDFPYGLRSHLATLFAGKVPTQKVQIVILNDAPLLLAYQVVNFGKLIFKRSDPVHHFFVFTIYKRYIDLKGLYKRQQQALLNRIKEGTYGEYNG